MTTRRGPLPAAAVEVEAPRPAEGVEDWGATSASDMRSGADALWGRLPPHPKNEPDEENPSGHFIEDSRVVSPHEVAERHILREQAMRVLAMLTAREEQVLRMRYGIGEIAPGTLEEVGRKLVLSRERVGKIEAGALRKLRYPRRPSVVFDLQNGRRAHSSGGQSRRLITGRSQVRVLVGPPLRGSREKI